MDGGCSLLLPGGPTEALIGRGGTGLGLSVASGAPCWEDVRRWVSSIAVAVDNKSEYKQEEVIQEKATYGVLHVLQTSLCLTQGLREETRETFRKRRNVVRRETVQGLL